MIYYIFYSIDYVLYPYLFHPYILYLMLKVNTHKVCALLGNLRVSVHLNNVATPATPKLISHENIKTCTSVFALS